MIEKTLEAFNDLLVNGPLVFAPTNFYKLGRVQDIPQLFTHAGRKAADKMGTGEIYKKVKTEFVQEITWTF